MAQWTTQIYMPLKFSFSQKIDILNRQYLNYMSELLSKLLKTIIGQCWECNENNQWNALLSAETGPMDQSHYRDIGCVEFQGLRKGYDIPEFTDLLIW